ncbi:MAG: PAS domain-containing protein [Kiritimatiellae bacterium]|nr:PAS domain-containing protein [Kiritimatiellia bacterium]
MSEQEKFSRTMRIDLIPDVPVKPDTQRGRKPVLKTGAQRPVLNSPRIVSSVGKGDSFYQHLLQGLYDAAIIIDMKGKIVDVNQRAIEFLKFEIDAFRQMSVFDVISGADSGLIDSLCENLELTQHALIQAYCLRSDGSNFPAEIAVSRLELDDPHLCFFVRDITIRKHAEEMLITEHCAIQNSGSGIAITTNSGDLDFVNPRVTEMWGSDEDELLGKALRSLMVEPSLVDTMFDALTEDDSSSWQGDMQGQGSDGEAFHVQVTGARNRNSEGEPIGFVFSILDLSDRMRAEESERVSERRRVMIESLGAACHHVGQPATILLGNLQFLKEKLASADADTAQIVDRCVDAMEEIGSILKRLNRVNEYKTRQYLEGSDDDDSASRILDI